MKTSRLLAIALLLSATMTWSACGDDTTTPSKSDCSSKTVTRGEMSTPPSLPDLTKREHVIYNIEVAYNKRRIDYYQGVLDQNFTFFLSAGDVNNGLPASWNRIDEVDINMKLFDRNNTTLPCQSIFLDIWAEDGVSWIEIIPESAPTETWYQTTLYYDFKFEISPNTYIPTTGAKAIFTVRDAGPYECYDHHWQLVELRDLDSDLVASRSSSATQPTTLGRVKSLYR